MLYFSESSKLCYIFYVILQNELFYNAQDHGQNATLCKMGRFRPSTDMVAATVPRGLS